MACIQAMLIQTSSDPNHIDLSNSPVLFTFVPTAFQNMSNSRLCTLMVHNTSHNTEELLLNPELFGDLAPGDFIMIYEPQNYESHLILKVPAMPPITGRLEISLTKVVAESNNLKPFSKVVIEKIDPDTASLDFVELSFKRQYLQRGNFFRFQNTMFGRPVYVNQNISINGIQAQIQEMHKETLTRRSGIITDRTKFVFRSRSARIIWLVQISAEMWEFDQVLLSFLIPTLVAQVDYSYLPGSP